jgi:hypothetical protein
VSPEESIQIQEAYNMDCSSHTVLAIRHNTIHQFYNQQVGNIIPKATQRAAHASHYTPATLYYQTSHTSGTYVLRYSELKLATLRFASAP